MNDTEYYLAAQNPGFPPQLTALIRFARPKARIVCPVCGAKTRKTWTMVIPFSSPLFGAIMPQGEAPFSAGTLICEDHPMQPALNSDLLCLEVSQA
jgi:hypothetical protein